jgi:hypothetical protein
MDRGHPGSGPEELVGRAPEYRREETQRTDRAEKSLLNGLVNEVVVGMVGLQWIQTGTFSRAIQQVGVPE